MDPEAEAEAELARQEQEDVELEAEAELELVEQEERERSSSSGFDASPARSNLTAPPAAGPGMASGAELRGAPALNAFERGGGIRQAVSEFAGGLGQATATGFQRKEIPTASAAVGSSALAGAAIPVGMASQALDHPIAATLGGLAGGAIGGPAGALAGAGLAASGANMVGNLWAGKTAEAGREAVENVVGPAPGQALDAYRETGSVTEAADRFARSGGVVSTGLSLLGLKGAKDFAGGIARGRARAARLAGLREQRASRRGASAEAPLPPPTAEPVDVYAGGSGDYYENGARKTPKGQGRIPTAAELAEQQRRYEEWTPGQKEGDAPAAVPEVPPAAVEPSPPVESPDIDMAAIEAEVAEWSKAAEPAPRKEGYLSNEQARPRVEVPDRAEIEARETPVPPEPPPEIKLTADPKPPAEVGQRLGVLDKNAEKLPQIRERNAARETWQKGSELAGALEARTRAGNERLMGLTEELAGELQRRQDMDPYQLGGAAIPRALEDVRPDPMRLEDVSGGTVRKGKPYDPMRTLSELDSTLAKKKDSETAYDLGYAGPAPGERLGGNAPPLPPPQLAGAGAPRRPPPPAAPSKIIPDFEPKTVLKSETYKRAGDDLRMVLPDKLAELGGKMFERLAGGNVDRLRALRGLPQYEMNIFNRNGALALREEVASATPRIQRDIYKGATGLTREEMLKFRDLSKSSPAARDIPRKWRSQTPFTPEEQAFVNKHRKMYETIMPKVDAYLAAHRSAGLSSGDLGPSYWPGGQAGAGAMVDAAAVAEGAGAAPFAKQAPEITRRQDQQRQVKTQTTDSIEALVNHLDDTVNKLTVDKEVKTLNKQVQKLLDEGKTTEALDLMEWTKKVVQQLPDDDVALETLLKQRGVAQLDVKAGDAFQGDGRNGSYAGPMKVLSKQLRGSEPTFTLEANGQKLDGEYTKGQVLAMMHPDDVAAVKPALVSVGSAQGAMARFLLSFNPKPVIKAAIFNPIRFAISNNRRGWERGLSAVRDLASLDDAVLMRYRDLGLLDQVEGVTSASDPGAIRAAVNKVSDVGMKPLAAVDQAHKVAQFEVHRETLARNHPDWSPAELDNRAKVLTAQMADVTGRHFESVRGRDHWGWRMMEFFQRPSVRVASQVAQLLRSAVRDKSGRDFAKAMGLVFVPPAVAAGAWQAAGRDPYDGFAALFSVPLVSAIFGGADVSAGASDKVKALARVGLKYVSDKEVTGDDLMRLAPPALRSAADIKEGGLPGALGKEYDGRDDDKPALQRFGQRIFR